MTKYSEIIPGIYFLKTEDPEIIPGNIVSYGEGSRVHILVDPLPGVETKC